MGTPGYSWVCAACGRRVPLRVDVCHCGATRQQAPAATAPATPPPAAHHGEAGASWRSLPRDVQGLLVAAGLIVVLGLGWLVYDPPRPTPAPALLGYVDVRPPPPTPTSPSRPPFRMPWWR